MCFFARKGNRAAFWNMVSEELGDAQSTREEDCVG
jgi:hypothetical protein